MILDATCGPKGMYHGLTRQFTTEEIIFIDVRKGTFTSINYPDKSVTVQPDILADDRHLPFRDNTFTLIIFDPPHGQYSMKSYLGPRFGGLTSRELRYLFIYANIEFHRVLKTPGYLLIKCVDSDDYDYKVKRAFTNFKLLLDIKYPSQAHTKGSKTNTHWLLYVKRPSSTL